MKIDVLLAEFAQSWRGLTHRPGYLMLAAATLALGIATTSAVFSLLDQALLKPLPYPQSERLAMLGMDNGDDTAIGSPLMYRRLGPTQGVTSSGLVSTSARSANIANDEIAVVASALSADSGFLRTLAVKLAAGRNFNTEEDRPNGPAAAILSHAFWLERFGGDPEILRQSLQIEGATVPVVGILPPGFEWPLPFDFLVPMQLEADSTNAGTNEHIIARLSADADIDIVGQQFDRNVRAAFEEQRATFGEDGYRYMTQQAYVAKPLINAFTSTSRTVLWLFFGAALCVLLIAGINLTNLMILRTIARSHETAVRTALGASNVRIAMPNLSEGLLIGIVGSLLGLVLAWTGLRLLDGLIPPEWLRGHGVDFTPATWFFGFATSVAIALSAAALGVWQGRYGNIAQELGGGGRSGLSRASSALGRGLVIAQTTIAVVLLVGAALFARSLLQLTSVPMGFESDRILTFNVSPIRSQYGDISAVIEQSQRIGDRMAAVPGVESIAASTNLPTGSQLNMPVVLANERTVSPQYRPISPTFLDVFGIPLLSGRVIGETDVAGAEAVCVVSDSFAKAFLGDQPLGKIVKAPSDMEGGFVPMRVVGVVGDVRQFGPDQPSPPIVYLPLAQVPAPIWTVIRDFTPVAFAAKVRGEPGGLEPLLRAAMREIDPAQPIGDLKPMDSIVRDTTGAQRLNLLLLSIFAGLSLLLACVGLYAVMSVAVMARQHEFGVRAALGSPPARLFRLVLRESTIQIATGLLAGLLISLAISKLIQRFLFGITAVDPLALAVVLVTLLLAGLAAGFWPALRASRVPPMMVLRG